MIVKKFNTFIVTEKLDLDSLKGKVGEENSDLKMDLVSLMNRTLESNSDENVKNDDLVKFIDEYISVGKDSTSIEGLIEDNDIFNFYLKHQSDIDTILNKNGYLQKSPVDNNVFGLFDIMLDGTKEAILDILKEIKPLI
jgi:hypothetical protein